MGLVKVTALEMRREVKEALARKVDRDELVVAGILPK
jgi:hypothetical protein